MGAINAGTKQRYENNVREPMEKDIEVSDSVQSTTEAGEDFEMVQIVIEGNAANILPKVSMSEDVEVQATIENDSRDVEVQVQSDYGRKTEGEARLFFSELSGQTVIETRLIVSKCNPWLAVSPDGIIFEDDVPVGVLEIQCPWKGASMTVPEGVYLLVNISSNHANSIGFVIWIDTAL
ncbi:hypothetical protein PV328_004320 [Microctonus aethiopoides]|uniref:YqaJ viral recombinase domain-containing protein n=1 Tax=Microctonus aethiopoides TaxID=144406 RepID=A0AA39KLL5_9HYME|nr:hypothetical protein PV328_004320 [Microctonus aethiopoides]